VRIRVSWAGVPPSRQQSICHSAAWRAQPRNPTACIVLLDTHGRWVCRWSLDSRASRRPSPSEAGNEWQVSEQRRPGPTAGRMAATFPSPERYGTWNGCINTTDKCETRPAARSTALPLSQRSRSRQIEMIYDVQVHGCNPRQPRQTHTAQHTPSAYNSLRESTSSRMLWACASRERSLRGHARVARLRPRTRHGPQGCRGRRGAFLGDDLIHVHLREVLFHDGNSVSVAHFAPINTLGPGRLIKPEEF
jgi:hypothetical protein